MVFVLHLCPYQWTGRLEESTDTGDVQLLPSCDDMARVSRAAAARSKRSDSTLLRGSPYQSIHSLQSEEGEEEEFSCTHCLKSGKCTQCVVISVNMYCSLAKVPIYKSGGVRRGGVRRGGVWWGPGLSCKCFHFCEGMLVFAISPIASYQ